MKTRLLSKKILRYFRKLIFSREKNANKADNKQHN